MKALVRKKLSDEVADRLEEMIREELYPEGSTLPPERELMELFGVGRPSIREALYALELKGLVKINSGERPRVTRPTPEHLLRSLSGSANLLLTQPRGVEHFDEARLFMEMGLARRSAEMATEAQIQELEAALQENRGHIGKARAFAVSDVGFHRRLALVVGNPIFVAMHEALVDWLISQRPLPADPVTANRQSFEEHEAVFQAIQGRDPDGASTAMRQHLENAQKKYR